MVHLDSVFVSFLLIGRDPDTSLTGTPPQKGGVFCAIILTSKINSMVKTYTLTITEAQAQALAYACDVLQRVQLGQWREIIDWLPLQKPIDYEELHQDQKIIGSILSKHMIDNIDGQFSSLGIGSSNLPDNNRVLYDLYKVITRELSMERLIDEGKILNKNVPRNQLPWTVNFDEIHRWGNEPLAKIEKVKDE